MLVETVIKTYNMLRQVLLQSLIVKYLKNNLLKIISYRLTVSIVTIFCPF